MKLADKVRSLPDSPGVYLMKDSEGQIIYVGKAVSLKRRVGSYFTKADRPLKQELLVSKIRDIDFVCTGSEAEALILEAGLIKEHKPRYNVAIKDDKSYPLLKLTVNEKFPRLLIVRRKKSDKALYFGPYTSGKLLRQAVDFMRRIFPLRTCRVMPSSLCLNYHLKQCTGPCAGRAERQEYQKTVDALVLFLQGKTKELTRQLSAQMRAASAVRDFEKAMELRDRIIALSSVCVPGKRFKVSDQIGELQDVLRLKNKPLIIEGYDISAISGESAVGAMVRFRDGHPCRSEYRRFKIKTVTGVDDYAMIEEVISRRFSGTLSRELDAPDLIIIDGGKGHLQCAVRRLRLLNIPVPAASIAKQFEYIYVEWQAEPVALPASSKALSLLMRIRDEAHRFAVTYYRNLHRKRMIVSELDQITGIGKKRKKILLNALSEVSAVKGLTLQQLKRIKGINGKTAKNIIEHWKKY